MNEHILTNFDGYSTIPCNICEHKYSCSMTVCYGFKPEVDEKGGAE